MGFTCTEGNLFRLMMFILVVERIDVRQHALDFPVLKGVLL